MDKNLKHEIEYITKRNESLAENKIKKEVEQLLSKHKHGNNIHEHGKQKNKWTTYCGSLSQRLDLRISNKHVALENLSINHTWKNIRK